MIQVEIVGELRRSGVYRPRRAAGAVIDADVARQFGRRFTWQYAGTGIGEADAVEPGMRRWRLADAAAAPQLGIVLEDDIDWLAKSALWKRLAKGAIRAAATPIAYAVLFPAVCWWAWRRGR